MPHSAQTIYRIEGICEELGHPLGSAAFCEAFRECFSGSYKAYTALENERLFSLSPLRIERWVYIDSLPYIETFDLSRQYYSFIRYEGR